MIRRKRQASGSTDQTASAANGLHGDVKGSHVDDALLPRRHQTSDQGLLASQIGNKNIHNSSAERKSVNGATQPIVGMNLTELITEQQVSMRWNFKLNTLRYWRAVGEGPPYVKIGRCVRYNVAALEKYLRRNTCESTARATAEEVLQHAAH